MVNTSLIRPAISGRGTLAGVWLTSHDRLDSTYKITIWVFPKIMVPPNHPF